MLRVYPKRLSKSVLETLEEQSSNFGVSTRDAYDPCLPVDLFQQSLNSVHETLGTSWPLTSVAFASFFRLITAPIYVRNPSHVSDNLNLGFIYQEWETES